MGVFECNGVVIGTMRFVPMRGGLSAMERLLGERPRLLPMPGGSSWEFGRLVLDPAYRAGADLLRRSVFLAVSHLVEKFGCVHAYASCNAVLSRLYRRFAFSVIADDVRVPGEDNPYSLIHARAADVLMAAASSDAERSAARRLLATGIQAP